MIRWKEWTSLVMVLLLVSGVTAEEELRINLRMVNVPTPATINQPEREPRHLTLSEAIALGLQNGVTDMHSLRGLGSMGDGFGGTIDALASPDDPIRFGQSRAQQERNLAFLLLNIETAYWNLYGAYVNLYSAEQALRQSYEAWRISKAKYEAGSIALTQFAQTKGQYEQFRGDRLAALDRVLEADRILRRLIGLPVEDGKRLVPVDEPTKTPPGLDWDTAVNEALTLRPELVLAREKLLRLENLLLPTPKLDCGDKQPDSERQAFLNLCDLQERAISNLASQYRAVSTGHAIIEARRAQREAYDQQVEARFKEFIAGKTTVDFLLEAQRQWVNALSTEYQAVVDYNNALARFQFAKGTLLRHHNVDITEKPMPVCAQVRVVKHDDDCAVPTLDCSEVRAVKPEDECAVPVEDPRRAWCGGNETVVARPWDVATCVARARKRLIEQKTMYWLQFCVQELDKNGRFDTLTRPQLVTVLGQPARAMAGQNVDLNLLPIGKHFVPPPNFLKCFRPDGFVAAQLQHTKTQQDNTIDVASSLEAKLTRLPRHGHLRMDLEIQLDQMPESGKDNVLFRSNLYRLVQVVELGKETIMVLDRDAQGKPIRWVTVTIGMWDRENATGIPVAPGAPQPCRDRD